MLSRYWRIVDEESGGSDMHDERTIYEVSPINLTVLAFVGFEVTRNVVNSRFLEYMRLEQSYRASTLVR